MNSMLFRPSDTSRPPALLAVAGGGGTSGGGHFGEPVLGWTSHFLQEVLGMYCHHILADYITLAAAPVGLAGQERPDMGTLGAATHRTPPA